ncbi:MAG: hypothetical protein WCV63_04875 [Negativicutes bacterium]|jgi:hypothetical protein
MNSKNPFMNKNYLDISASLNKILMVEIPGFPYSRQIAGHSAQAVLSSEAIATLVREAFDLPNDTPRSAAIGVLHRQLVEDRFEVRERAELVCEEIALNIGCLLLILTKQNINKNAARLDWDATQWAWWQSVERVVIGGGVLAAAVGEKVYEYINRHFIDTGLIDISVELSACAEYMPLVGAGNKLISMGMPGCILDFGHSSCKRAIFARDEQLEMLSKCELGNEVAYDAASNNREVAQILNGRIVEIACATVTAAVERIIGLRKIGLVISIANYYDGRHFATRGGYAKLNFISNDYCQYLTNEIKHRTGVDVEISFVHDCTAAALSITDELKKKTAVVVLGTGLGAGFCS